MQLKEELTLIQRESHSLLEYLHAIKVLVDKLVVIDSPVSANKITLYVLNGLGLEYREIAVPIQEHETYLTFEELHDIQRRSNFGCNNHKEQSGKPQIVCQLCDKVGHSARTCYSALGVKYVNCATTYVSTNRKWLVDSATSHCITSNLANLFVHSEYDGTDEVIIDDDLGLRVTHDRSTLVTLLRYKCQDGVYPMPMVSSPKASFISALVGE
ncbi:uncharacterized protein LOC131167500 [Malania oleifera]|uniref:uncharacterized protein LOC131167500 n=1 Tax=Malania oleifera TaxID=397392 RepID=UPI0025AE53D2|nr:uncharacterized protein LOC131167500 [Malania oleifera]